jgi:itaconate CoA-transferase
MQSIGDARTDPMRCVEDCMYTSNPYATLYREKLVSADDAVASFPEGGLLIPGTGQAEPPALLWAFANRLREGNLKKLRIFSSLAMQNALDTVLAVDLSDAVERCSGFVGSGDRGLVSVGLNYYLPNHLHQLPRLIREHMEVEACATTVSPMDRAGYFTFGVANDFTSTAARCAKRLLVEVNEYMPRVHGDSRIHISEVAAVVENHAPLYEIARATPSPTDETIANMIADMVPDGATLQIGIGELPAAVCSFLKDRKDLGIHTEFLCAPMVDLIRVGAATGAKKTLHPHRHVFTVALAPADMLDFMHDNPAFESYPVSYTNHPAVIAQNANMISINSVIEVDLSGQCNAEFLAGHQFSGSGGQLDFVRGAYDSEGGKSILAFHSTAKDGTVSRIVPRLSENAIVTTPRNDTQYLATEFGVTNLKGQSTRDRALALIALAHPKFRDDLLRAAEDMYIV